MSHYIIKNTIIVNEGKQLQGDVLIQQGRIQKIAPQIDTPAGVKEIDGSGQYLIPGAIDDQVHFRLVLWKCPIPNPPFLPKHY